MDIEKMLFVQSVKKSNDNNKWIIHFIIGVIMYCLIGIINSYMQNGKIEFLSSLVIAIFNVTFSILIIFLIILTISKIMKSETKVAIIFSSSVFIMLCLTVFNGIVTIVQSMFSLDTSEYSIISLNIFNSNIPELAAFNLINLLFPYLVWVVLYTVSKLTLKSSIIWAILVGIVNLAIDLLVIQLVEVLKTLM
ncbi:hypothetical protein [Staphylococcus intermedius]|uniref:Yip1 domain-containing protein n=1 Tax=Staphylococcus intermedius NCTC 11048 TaxID=1141106 RepID=A0A380FYL4_STAIN|nr:hypothetical protein [Staphylococcus intermedius]PCF84086.1 hypothetical protein B4W76_12305 [Staphylococcus intermedius]PCF85032.1 hypothetical protein B4W75_12640 [Staphylococcus intermedius]PNZ49712.1 hypothetical protein CD138_12590 [Staphylococcus intermedius NCTC 11048]SUM43825.1 Uncharacterised protein [Staphylococcus intermedius NCTC 11048]